MLAISVRLIHGTIRAGSPDDTTLAGGEPTGEWPPSPARLFAALVSADGTRARCKVTDGQELRWLERLDPPAILAEENVETTPLSTRFVPIDRTTDGMVQDYPARLAAEVRPGVRSSPRTLTVVYVWEDDPPDGVLDALQRRAARVGYLGCADSPVQVSVATELPRVDVPRWTPGSDVGVSLPVPYEGFLDALDHAFDEWTAGRPMRRAWIPTKRERYGLASRNEEPPRATVFWFEFDRRVVPRAALRVTSTLRAATLDLLDPMFDGSQAGRNVPWQLHGHDIPPDMSRPYQLVRYLALPNVGHRHSDGYIHGAAIWLPPELDPEIVEAVRVVALGRLKRLTAPGLDVRLSPRTGRAGKWSTRPQRWIGPAARWFSATPIVAERGRRGGPTLDDVQRWFANAGFPVPSAGRVSSVPTRSGVPRLQPRDVHRHDSDRYPYYWLEVRFDEPIGGPICVGRSRSFGLGLLAPVMGSGWNGEQ